MIPVVDKKVWDVLSSRLKGAPLSYSKRMETINEHDIQRLVGSCRYPPTHGLLEWKHRMEVFPLRLYPVNPDMCLHCYNTDLRIDQKQGALICSGCGFICAENVHDSSSYTQSYSIMATHSRQQQHIPRKHTENTYKRCNHFRETLLRLQGVEKVNITGRELQLIKLEITKRRINTEDLRADTMKLILRQIGLQKFYNHTYYILKQLTGNALVTFTRSQTDILYSMFIKIQRPFADHAPHRANMISYIYIIKKLCEILEWDDVAAALHHLKSTNKIMQQDIIWKKICRSVGFRFTASVI
jgi:hypothetical protein